jgi:hypothetical protein
VFFVGRVGSDDRSEGMALVHLLVLLPLFAVVVVAAFVTASVRRICGGNAPLQLGIPRGLIRR